MRPFGFPDDPNAPPGSDLFSAAQQGWAVLQHAFEHMLETDD